MTKNFTSTSQANKLDLGVEYYKPRNNENKNAHKEDHDIKLTAGTI